MAEELWYHIGDFFKKTVMRRQQRQQMKEEEREPLLETVFKVWGQESFFVAVLRSGLHLQLLFSV